MPSTGPAAGPGARNPRDRARQGAAGSLHHAYTNPVAGSPEAVRTNLREALRLLREAGYEVRDRKLVERQDRRAVQRRVPGRRSDLRAHRAVLQAVARTARHRRDGAHRRRRPVREPAAQLGLRHHRSRPGASRCRPATSSATSGARRPPISAGSRNLVGIKNPAVDALIERVIFAKDRDELVAATKALDRVLLWNHYVVPQWTYGKVRTARWDRFGRPDPLPKYGASGFPDRLVVGRGERPPRPERRAVTNLSAARPVAPRRACRSAPRRRSPATRRCRARSARRSGRAETPRHLGLRRSEVSGRLPHFDYVNPNAPKGGVFSQIGPSRQFNQIFLTFNSLNSYILKGDAAQGMELTFATLMARAQRRARRDVWPGRARGAHLRRQADLPFLLRPEARFHDGTHADRARRRLLAQHPEGEGPSDHHADAARLRRRRGGRRRDRGGALRREARARRAAVRRRPADLLARLLRQPPVRRNRRSTFRSAPAPTRSAASRPAATSNTSG